MQERISCHGSNNINSNNAYGLFDEVVVPVLRIAGALISRVGDEQCVTLTIGINL